MAEKTFFRGIGYPFRRSATSLPARVSDAELIRQSLVQIVGTQKGERVMRPDFGTNVIAYIFGNNTDLLAELIRADLFAAIGRYEPRVILQAIVVDRSDTLVDVDIRYVIAATGVADRVKLSYALP